MSAAVPIISCNITVSCRAGVNSVWKLMNDKNITNQSAKLLSDPITWCVFILQSVSLFDRGCLLIHGSLCCCHSVISLFVSKTKTETDCSL